MDYEIAVLVTLLVVVLYTSLGGFLSVARTDVVQGAMMLAGSLMIGYFVITRASELSGESGILGDARLAPMLSWNAGLPFAVLLGIILSGSLKLLVDPRQVSRFFALEDQRAVRSGMLIAMLMVLLIQLGLFPVGVLAHLFFDSAPGTGSNITDTDMIMPLLLQRDDVFPFWASDVLLVAIVAAAMSSMDSVLLVAASVCVRDLLGGQPARGLLLTRIAVVGLAVLAAIIALRPPGDIVAITIFSGSLYAACFLPVLLLSLHWSRGHAAAVLGSMLTGMVVLLSWLGAGLSSHMHEVFPALLSSALVFLGMSSHVAAAVARFRPLGADRAQPRPTTMTSPLADFILTHQRVAVITGAGCSTDSGIGAYRDRAGNWQHSEPNPACGLHERSRNPTALLGALDGGLAAVRPGRAE